MNYNELNFQGLQAERQWDVAEAFPVLMRKVYVWMTLALAITGFTAYGVATSPGILQAIYGNQILFWGLIIAEFALVIGVSAAINKLSLPVATLMFVAYSIINGALLSYIFLAYTSSSIATVFFITAGTFGAMAIVGYTTKTDLSSMGKYLLMALIGLIIATLVNVFFVKSTGFELILSYAGVLIFVGLTAYDTQKIKQMLMQAPDADETAQKYALLGALSLYLDFINLFIYLLRIFGKRE
jgi:FtsH-binding integral membrane protein